MQEKQTYQDGGVKRNERKRTYSSKYSINIAQNVKRPVRTYGTYGQDSLKRIEKKKRTRKLKKDTDSLE